MDGGDHSRREIGSDYLTATARQAKGGAEKRLSRRGSKRHDDFGLHGVDFRLQPWPACLDLDAAGLCVDPPLAAPNKSEMLHRICDIDVGFVDLGIAHRGPQQSTSRPDERMARQIFGVARLLADEHESRPRIPFTEHRLCRVDVEIAALTVAGSSAQSFDRHGPRHVGSGSGSGVLATERWQCKVTSLGDYPDRAASMLAAASQANVGSQCVET